jgi:hypothetical protein
MLPDSSASFMTLPLASVDHSTATSPSPAAAAFLSISRSRSITMKAR